MSTTIRPELSENNKYYISKHRYYELKHFCLQYLYWKRQYVLLSGFRRRPELYQKVQNSAISDPTASIAEEMAYYSKLIGIVERAAIKTDKELGSFILVSVTEGLSYDAVKLRLQIPCCRDKYYELYRRFFWILDKERD